jgi:hypothetical protein
MTAVRAGSLARAGPAQSRTRSPPSRLGCALAQVLAQVLDSRSLRC